jgi:hypothetical protein
MRPVARWLRKTDDDGTIGILTLGFTVLALMVLFVVASATAVHVARMRLVHLADELAVDAADAMNAPAYFAGHPGEAPELADERMREAVIRHVGTRGTGSLEGVHLVDVSTADDGSATVTVEMVVYPLFGLEALMPFADGITLTATGQSRAF